MIVLNFGDALLIARSIEYGVTEIDPCNPIPAIFLLFRRSELDNTAYYARCERAAAGKSWRS